jgi:hypothetical protein
MIDAERHVRAMAVTADHIKAQVVPADGLGLVLESLSELALRGVRMVVLAELDQLRDLAWTRSKRGRSRPMFWGRFWGVEDLVVSVRTELDRVTNPWRACRDLPGSDRAAYRGALRAAHAAMRKLGDASELSGFLRDGQTRNNWPALQSLCGRMRIALTIRLDVDPDLPLLVMERPLSKRAVERAS